VRPQGGRECSIDFTRSRVSWERLAQRRLAAGDWSGLRPALAGLALLVGADLLLEAAAITTSFAIPPFLAALAGGRWATLTVSIAAVGLAVLSGVWNGNLGSEDYLVRVGLVALAGVAASFAARAAAEERETVRRFALLNDVSSVADGTTPLPVTMRLISDLIVPELADHCMIDVVAEGRVDRVAVHASGPDRDLVEDRLMRRVPSVPAQIVEADDSAAIEPRFWERVTDEHLRSISHDEKDLGFLRGLGVRSAITVALVSRGRRVGALTLVSAWSGRGYSRDDVRFAHVLGDRVALALDNVGLFSDLQSVERRMDTVMKVLDEAVVIFDRNRRLVFANDSAATMLGFGSVRELIGAPEGTVRGRFDLYEEGGAPLRYDEFAPIRALRGEQVPPQIIRAISRDDGRELWLRAKAGVVEGMDSTPLYAVTALEDVTEIKEAEFEQTLMARMGQLLDSALNFEEMGQRLAELLIPQLADRCSVHSRRPDGSIERVAEARPGSGGEEEQKGPREVGVDGVNRVIVEGQPLAVESEDGCAILLPLRVGHSVTGVLRLVNDSDRQPFDDLDRSLGEKVAERAAVALENARLGTERSEIARTLQQGLLPAPLPHIPGWSLAALYHPAGSENEVGGDFYDAFAFRGGWMLVVGDVTGRGARAASVTALARYTLRTASALSGGSAGRLRRPQPRPDRTGGLGPLHGRGDRDQRGQRYRGANRGRRTPAAAFDRHHRGARGRRHRTGARCLSRSRMEAPSHPARGGSAARRLHRWGDRGARQRGSLRRGAPAGHAARGHQPGRGRGEDRAGAGVVLRRRSA
jgi:PAS domain-containing protein